MKRLLSKEIKLRISIKSLIVFVLVATIAGTSIAAVPTAIQATLSPDVTVRLNGEVQRFTDVNGNVVYPILYRGTTYLPIRAVAGLVGLGVEWDGANRTVLLEGNGAPATPTPSNNSVKLSSLSYFAREGQDFEIKEQERANTGDYYNDCIIYDIGVAVLVRKGTRDYLLNSQYKTISGDIFTTYESRSSGGVAKLLMWGDGKLIYSSDEIRAGTLPHSFNVDISGVNVLKIGYERVDWDGSWTPSFKFATSNVTLQR
jgi:hypothetical protein